MFALVENGSITKMLNSNRGLNLGENQYPQAIYSLWSTAEREAIGVYEVVWDNTNKKEGEYYNNTKQSFNFADGVVTASFGSATARSLVDVTAEDGTILLGLKSLKKNDIKKQANSLLDTSDWYVVKATEVGSYSVPAETTTYRAAVRSKSNDMEALVDGCNTVEELEALYQTTTEADGTITPRPLGEFPEEV